MIWFPGSQRVLIYSATATADGKILASGTAEKIDGSHASFIALTDRAGKSDGRYPNEGFCPRKYMSSTRRECVGFWRNRVR